MAQAEVIIGKRGIERILSGHPWIYRADVTDASAAEPGAIVRVMDRRKRFWGQALYSNKSQIALRLLTRESRPFDRAFLAERIAAAAAFREKVAAGAQAIGGGVLQLGGERAAADARAVSLGDAQHGGDGVVHLARGGPCQRVQVAPSPERDAARGICVGHEHPQRGFGLPASA